MEKTSTPPQLQALFYSGSIEDNWLGHIMAEVYKDQVYRPYLPFDKAGTIALDIGAHIGIVSLYLSRYFERVVSLEPSTRHFQALEKNIVSNLAANVTAINKAIYIREGEFPFGGPIDNYTMRSLHVSTWQDGKSDETVQAITIEQLFNEQNIDRVTLMKLDVEGSETEIVAGDSFKRIAERIETMIIEQHDWSGRHPNQLREALKDAGFTKIETIPNDAKLLVAKR